MPPLTEATLRTAASWQAFKEGKSLLESGAVLDAKITDAGWEGSVRSGKRPLRVSVKLKSATDIEARCPCPDNQRNGAVCCHAVATGLAALTGGTSAAIPKSNQPTPSGPTVIPWSIAFAANWRETIQRGKLAVTLAHAKDVEIVPADQRLSTWLAGERLSSKTTLHLSLADALAATFLEAITNHPRVSAPGSDAFEISTGGLSRIPSIERHGDEIEIVPADPWLKLGGTYWQLSISSNVRAGEGTLPSPIHDPLSLQSLLVRAGEGALPDKISAELAKLFEGRRLRLSTSHFFNHLDAFQEWIEFPEKSWLQEIHFIPARCHFELSLEGSLQHLEATLRAVYPDSTPVLPGLGTVDNLPQLVGKRCWVRDFAAEERALARLVAAGFEGFGTLSLDGEKRVLDFVAKTLPRLKSDWKIIEGERFAKLRKQVITVSPTINILGSGDDWLSFDLIFQTSDGIRVDPAEIRRLLRSGNGPAKISNNRRMVISDDVAGMLDPLFEELDLRKEGGHFVASARAGELIHEIRKKFSKHLGADDLTNEITWQNPDTLEAELRPYQQVGAAWLDDRLGRYGGALLADDMGLGKTLQTIACIERLFAGDQAGSKAVLVIATASLLGNWRAEFARFAPARTVRILHGASRDKEREKIGSGDVVLTSYGTLARDLAYHLQREYLAVVVDEASLMRNPDTDHAKAVCKLKSGCRIALTGTPVENGVQDLWSIFRFIQPGWLGRREEFRERYELPLASGDSRGRVMERLILKSSPFLLRRTKQQVAPELPSKILIDEYCDLSPDQQAVYKELQVEGRKRVEAISDSGNQGTARMQMLTALLRLRQACCDLALFENDGFKRLLVSKRSSKLERLLELLQEAILGGHRILVFSQFQKQLVEIEKCVAERGWTSLRLDGQSRNRQQLVDNFQKPDGPPLFLISLKAGGYGLNLTAADIVIHFDPWWNPAAEAQATDRAHRIGQTRPVTVYRLLTRGTVEEKVLRLQSKKRELALAVDESGTGDAAGWSADDLKSMLL